MGEGVVCGAVLGKIIGAYTIIKYEVELLC